MLDVAVQLESDWDSGHDWQTLATAAVTTAVRNSPHRALIDSAACVEVTVRLTADDEVRQLNAAYRAKDKPTNVLSFPLVQADLLETLCNSDDGEVLLGDIILAHGVCAREAADKGLSVADHATHLIVHGTYHLLGYDHQGTAEAEAMEALEVRALAELGIDDPYLIDEDRG